MTKIIKSDSPAEYYYGWIIVAVALVSMAFWFGIRSSFCIFFGIGWGVTAPMLMSVSADLFKGKVYGLIYGFVEAGVVIAGATGAWLAGFIFDQTQSYYLAFILAIAAFVSSCVFIWIAAPRKFRYQQNGNP